MKEILNTPRLVLYFHICKTRDLDVKKNMVLKMQTKRCVKKIRQTVSMQTAGPADGPKKLGAQKCPVVIEGHLKEKCFFYNYQKIRGNQYGSVG